MSQLERMKAAANRKPKEKTPEKNLPVEKPKKAINPAFVGLPSLPCEACGVDHPTPISHDHYVFLKCKKPWVKKPKKQLSRAERLDKKMAAKRLPDASHFEATYNAEKKEWSGVMMIREDNDNLMLEGSHSGIFNLLILLDIKYRKHLSAKFAPVVPEGAGHAS